MQPISTCDPRLLAEVVNLSLYFPSFTHRSWTLRDQFIKAVTHPLGGGRKAARLMIFDNVSFRIFKGDRIGILGVNGVGKTTLCHCLTGTYKPSGGYIRCFGRVRGIFDAAIGIYPELTGRENARLMMHFLYPEFSTRHAELVAEALEFSELGEFLDSPYRVYSNGMRARLCLSLISCLPSDILILDEVFDGADRFFREKISARIVSVIERSGSAVFVSHSLEQLRRVCNRILVLNRGQVIYDGDLDSGFKEYAALNPPREQFSQRDF